jgi:hypothetical protein
MIRGFADEAGANGEAALFERQTRMEFVFPQRYSANSVQLIAPAGTNGENFVVDERDKEGRERCFTTSIQYVQTKN